MESLEYQCPIGLSRVDVPMALPLLPIAVPGQKIAQRAMPSAIQKAAEIPEICGLDVRKAL